MTPEVGASPVHYRYQIGRGLLVTGVLCLGAGVLLLSAFAFNEGLAWYWWLVNIVMMMLWALTAYVWRQTAVHGPIQVHIGDSGIAVPTGLSGTEFLQVDWSHVYAVRVIGRGGTLGKGATKEALYVVYEPDKSKSQLKAETQGEMEGQEPARLSRDKGKYFVLMSEMFEAYHVYAQCRASVLRRAKTANPNIRIDVNGELFAEVDPELLDESQE